MEKTTVPILRARAIDHSAGIALRALWTRFWSKVEGVWACSDLSAWSAEVALVYNPLITWRPKASLREADQYAILK